jgi:hypothetical protein
MKQLVLVLGCLILAGCVGSPGHRMFYPEEYAAGTQCNYPELSLNGTYLAPCHSSRLSTVQTGPTQEELWKRESDRVKVAYEQAFATNQAIDPIRGKIARWVKETTFEMLANNAKPTESERAAILEYAKLSEVLYARSRELDTQHNNLFGRINEAFYQADLALLADLYNGVLTYGEYAKKSQEGYAIAQQRFQDERQRLQAERDARFQAVAPFLFQTPPPVYMPPPTPMMVLPPSVNCTSTKIGSSIFTNCR